MRETMPKLAQHLTVQIRVEDGSLWATVDEFPGVMATGDNLEELRESLQEGIALMLAQPGEDPPAVTLSEIQPGLAVASPELVYA